MIWHVQAVDLVNEWGVVAVNMSIIPGGLHLLAPYTHSDLKDLDGRKSTYRGGTCKTSTDLGNQIVSSSANHPRTDVTIHT